MSSAFFRIALVATTLTVAALATAPGWSPASAQAEGARSPSAAQVPDKDRLFASFDARLLAASEKRLIQIGLTVEGVYNGMIDGAWGRRSQASLEAFVARDYKDFQGEARFIHAIAAAIAGHRFLSESGRAYRHFEKYDLTMIAPEGALQKRGDSGKTEVLVDDDSLTYGFFLSGDPSTLAIHDSLAFDRANKAEAYTVRRKDLLVTNAALPGENRYARSELLRPGLWTTVVVIGPPDPVFWAVTASITRDRNARAELVSNSTFFGAFEALAGLLRSEEDAETAAAAHQIAGTNTSLEPDGRRDALRDTRPGANTGLGGDAAEGLDPKSAGDITGTGTAFYVNNVDLVTAGHVVDGCAQMSFEDGAPMRVVARHPSLDLALLSSERRSRAWLSLDRTGQGRLGQKVFALGYPFYGLTGTSLNLTAGNVSAENGLGDNPSVLTITAAVQPGNSGGPLLDRDGAIIGVVIAKLSAKAMLASIGTLPENVNFAVRGAELIKFLDVNAVLYPRGQETVFDLEEGVPEHVQGAIVPVFCHD